MTVVMDDDIELDQCEGCGGTWFDRGELEATLAKPPDADAEAPVARDDTNSDVVQFQINETLKYRHCPHCKAQMARRNYELLSGVIIDVCPHHGAFLDPGELDQIRAFLRSGGKDAATAERNREAQWERETKERVDALKRRLDARRERQARAYRRDHLHDLIHEVVFWD